MIVFPLPMDLSGILEHHLDHWLPTSVRKATRWLEIPNGHVKVMGTGMGLHQCVYKTIQVSDIYTIRQ